MKTKRAKDGMQDVRAIDVRLFGVDKANLIAAIDRLRTHIADGSVSFHRLRVDREIGEHGWERLDR